MKVHEQACPQNLSCQHLVTELAGNPFVVLLLTQCSLKSEDLEACLMLLVHSEATI